MQISETVLAWVLSILSAIITTVLLPMLVNYINSKTTNAKIQLVVSELGTTVSSAVSYVNQTYVDALKAEGKFDDVAKQEARKMCIDYIKQTLSDSVKKIIGEEGIDFQALLIKHIEAEINKK